MEIRKYMTKSGKKSQSPKNSNTRNGGGDVEELMLMRESHTSMHVARGGRGTPEGASGDVEGRRKVACAAQVHQVSECV